MVPALVIVFIKCEWIQNYNRLEQVQLKECSVLVLNASLNEKA
jgi:hypothetical protein